MPFQKMLTCKAVVVLFSDNFHMQRELSTIILMSTSCLEKTIFPSEAKRLVQHETSPAPGSRVDAISKQLLKQSKRSKLIVLLLSKQLLCLSSDITAKSLRSISSRVLSKSNVLCIRMQYNDYSLLMDTGSVFEERIVLADCEIIIGVDESHVPAKTGEKVLVVSKDETGR